MREMKRVVVTGTGVISAVGCGTDNYWNSLKTGRCGVGTIQCFDPSRFSCRVAAEAKSFVPSDYLEHKMIQRTARFTQMAVVAAREAWNQAKLAVPAEEPDDTAIILGNGIGGLEVDSESQRKLVEKGPSRMSAMTIPRMISNEAAGNIAIEFKIHGIAHTLVTACASGTDALGYAFDYIRSGRANVVIAGGVEAAITEFGIGAFCALKALSTAYNDTPQKASRPFDRDRDGFVMGEGAGILILEPLEHALARNAEILGEIVGYGATTDAYHLTAPDSTAECPTRAFQLALRDAGLRPEDVDYINAHGTSTPTNDPIETLAIKKALGEHAGRIRVSSIKGMIGHCLRAAGALEGI
ncbi:MAG: beta-ketoacyl-ACP synthase II, partial [Thermoguttaceae bacterium]|nr:beta-ketoacyl-ACP synthase II [Thermoguttaceae bacterium]